MAGNNHSAEFLTWEGSPKKTEGSSDLRLLTLSRGRYRASGFRRHNQGSFTPRVLPSWYTNQSNESRSAAKDYLRDDPSICHIFNPCDDRVSWKEGPSYHSCPILHHFYHFLISNFIPIFILINLHLFLLFISHFIGFLFILIMLHYLYSRSIGRRASSRVSWVVPKTHWIFFFYFNARVTVHARFFFKMNKKIQFNNYFLTSGIFYYFLIIFLNFSNIYWSLQSSF